MTAAFLSLFWSVIISENFCLKYHECLKKKRKRKRGFSLHFSVLTFFLCFYLILKCLTWKLLCASDIRATVRPCAGWRNVCTVTHGPTFKFVPLYISNQDLVGKPRLSSLTWCPGRPQSQMMLFPHTPLWQTFVNNKKVMSSYNLEWRRDHSSLVRGTLAGPAMTQLFSRMYLMFKVDFM